MRLCFRLAKQLVLLTAQSLEEHVNERFCTHDGSDFKGVTLARSCGQDECSASESGGCRLQALVRALKPQQ
jgi:hypothetical protein